MSINLLKNEQIDAALSHELRQYLSGRLARPQEELPCIESDIEIGISDYKEYTAEVPHYHSAADEYIYLLSGSLKVWFWEQEKEYCLTIGDFLRLSPGTKYAAKALAGSRTLFVKAPGGNDKVTDFPVPETVKAWLEKWE